LQNAFIRLCVIEDLMLTLQSEKKEQVLKNYTYIKKPLKVVRDTNQAFKIMIFDMFDAPLFSKDGRIERKTYTFFFVAGMAYTVLLITFQMLFPDFHLPEFISKEKYSMAILGFLMFSPFVILIFKSSERCHDLGVNGFYQLIPFFFLFLLFVVGQNSPNKYGKSPSKEQTEEITLLNRGTVSVAISKTATFKMFLKLLGLLLFVIIAIVMIF
jgi:uncharacterized membrane protein YhaH (DUF805 family)